MEEENRIDRLFQERLSEGEVAPASGDWQAIQAKMGNGASGKSNKKMMVPFLWFTAAFFSGAFLGATTLYTLYLKEENIGLKQELKAQKLENHELSQQLLVLNSSQRKEEEDMDKRFAQVADDSFDEQEFERKYIRNKNDQEFNHKQNYFGNKLLKSKNEYTTNSGVFSNKTNPTVHSSNAELVMNKNDKIKNRTLVNVSGSNNVLNDGQIGTAVQKELIVFDNAVSPNNDSSKEIGSVIAQTSTLKIDTVSIPNDSVKREPKEQALKKVKKAPKILGFPIAIGIYISPEMASRSVHFNSNQNEDVVKYKNNDKNKFGFSAGLNLEIELPRNYFLRSGISYWNVGENNSSVYQTTKNDTTYRPNSVSLISNTPNGGPQVIVRNDTINRIPSTSFTFSTGQSYSVPAVAEIKESVSKFSSTVQNNYHYIGIPLAVGMRLGRSKLRAGLYSGLIANVLVSSNRAVYAVYHNPEHPEEYTYAYRQLSRFSFVYWGGIDLDYQLVENWSISLSPNIKYALNTLYSNESDVKQLPYSIGIMVGCKYSFGKK